MSIKYGRKKIKGEIKKKKSNSKTILHKKTTIKKIRIKFD